MSSVPRKEKEVLSVTELTQAINFVLEDTFSAIRFEGEISELSIAKSGHLYITLKDETAQLSTAVWRSTASTLGFRPTVGMKVLCEGRPNIYPQSGRFQVIINRMQPSGEGVLQKKFLELKAKLEKEGLFDPSRKRSLPLFPLAVGVVTSKSGAVIHDIMVRIKDRMPNLQVYLIDVRVQGEGAAAEIAKGIQLLNESKKVDVIIVGRGGGSIEDLWAFNEEEVVRAIFASQVPIISSVGHETDVTLSDFAADIRAPTPTAAAEMVCFKRVDLLSRISELSSRLLEFERWFNPKEQRVDELEIRMLRFIKTRLSDARRTASHGDSLLRLLIPERQIAVSMHKVDGLETRLSNTLTHQLDARRNRIKSMSEKLEALNPLGVLQRGFALVHKNGQLVRSPDSLGAGDTIETTFAKGNAVRSIVA